MKFDDIWFDGTRQWKCQRCQSDDYERALLLSRHNVIEVCICDKCLKGLSDELDLLWQQSDEERNKFAQDKRPPDKNAVLRRERLAQARAKGTHTKKQWSRMIDFFGSTCVRCGQEADVVKDHIIPIYQGGSDSIKNLQPLCWACNSSKGSEDIDYRPVFCGQNGLAMPLEWTVEPCPAM